MLKTRQKIDSFVCRKPAAAVQVVGALASEYRSALDAGLVIVPMVPGNAKKPAWKKWAQRKVAPRVGTIEKYLRRNPMANWAYVPGASDLVVVDCDTIEVREQAVAIFGRTPVEVRTSRGFHLLYRKRGGVPSVDLRRYGFEGEIKSQRVLVVGWGCPHPDGSCRYELVGNVEDITRLPEFSTVALASLIGDEPVPTVQRPAAPRNVEGNRNGALFDHLRGVGAAGVFRSFEDVVADGFSYNEEMNDPPLDASEVRKTAGSVWKAVQEGRCRAPKRHCAATITLTDFELFDAIDPNLYNVADAMALYCKLRGAHAARNVRGETFAIAAKSMTERSVIPGWTDRKRYCRARDALLSVGLIKMVRGVTLTKWTDQTGVRRATGKTAAQYCFGG